MPPVQQMLPPRPIAPPKPIQEPPKPQMPVNPELAWDKIAPLFDDPTVTHIECMGPGKALLVSRSGRKQLTKISLAQEEIKKILQTISEEAHIPLLEGVFRASLDNYSIHAVVSDIVGSKFVIKKNPPYNMI